MTNTWASLTAVLLFSAGVFGAGAAYPQKVNRSDLSQPSPGEIVMAYECRNTYTRMRELEKLLNQNRQAFGALTVDVNKSGNRLDELEAMFTAKSAKSQVGNETYQAALKAKEDYEVAAKGHNALIDKQDALNVKRSKLSDEFFVLNPEYVGKCSGTIFKAKSIILTCKDEQSQWCDLLK